MSKMKYSGIEWIGDVPIDWKVNRLRYNCTFKTGGTPPDKYGINTDADGYPWITAQDMNNGMIIKNYSQYITEESRKYCSYKLFPRDTILLVCIASVGKIGYLLESAYSNQQITALMPNKNIFAKYLLYLIAANSPTIIKDASSNVVPIINTQYLANIYCCLPNINEQKLIANFLDEKVSNLDNILIDLRKQIEILNDYRKSLITECITKGLDKNVKFKESRVGKIPLSWETKHIKYICNIQPKVCYKNIREDDFVTFLPMDHIKKGYFINNQAKLYDNDNSYTSFEEGDIIMAKVTPCFENGNIAITKDLHNGYGFGSSELFVFRANDYVEQKFLFYWLQNDYFVKTATSNMTGAAGLKRVPLNFIRNYYISIPKLDEQKEIVDYLDKKCEQIDKIIEEKQKQIEKIEEYKKSVIYEYVTGKKRVEGAEELYG